MAYADRQGLRPDAANVLWTVMRKMDQAERRWQMDNLKAGPGHG